MRWCRVTPSIFSHIEGNVFSMYRYPAIKINQKVGVLVVIGIKVGVKLIIEWILLIPISTNCPPKNNL